jgi:hypothetical protein
MKEGKKEGEKMKEDNTGLLSPTVDEVRARGRHGRGKGRACVIHRISS